MLRGPDGRHSRLQVTYEHVHIFFWCSVGLSLTSVVPAVAAASSSSSMPAHDDTRISSNEKL